MAFYFNASGAPDAHRCASITFAVMAPSLIAITESIQRQAASKWLWDSHHLAARLRISTEELNEFIARIQSGGSGVKKDGTWLANPAPYDLKIDLTKHEDNSLNLHLVDLGKKHLCGSEFPEPTPAIVESTCKYFRLGNMRSINKHVTAKVQREIARYMMGTHQTLVQHWPVDGERRRRTWRLWVAGETGGDLFHKVDLPVIASFFWNVWDAPVSARTDPKDITPTVLDLVKREIVELLVRMYVVPANTLDCIMVRRSRRNSLVGEINRDEIVPAETSRKRKRPTYIISSPDEDSESEKDDIDDDEVKATSKLFDKGELISLWRNGEHEEVGRREIALSAAHQGKGLAYVNHLIQDCGCQRTYSIADFDAITSIPKSKLGRKLRNFLMLRDEINQHSGMVLFRVREHKFLLKHVHDAKRWNEYGVELTQELFEPTGPRKLKPHVAFLLRHILFAFPKLGISRQPELLSLMFVMIGGKAPTKDDIPSVPTIRSNATRLNELDIIAIGKMFSALAKDLSPCGNQRKFGMMTDDSKQGGGNSDKTHVTIFTCDGGGKSLNRTSDNPKERWSMNPIFVLGSISPSLQADWEGNSDRNIVDINRIIPRDAQGR